MEAVSGLLPLSSSSLAPNCCWNTARLPFPFSNSLFGAEIWNMLGSPCALPGEPLGLGAAQCPAPLVAPAIPGQLRFAGESLNFGAETK